MYEQFFTVFIIAIGKSSYTPRFLTSFIQFQLSLLGYLFQTKMQQSQSIAAYGVPGRIRTSDLRSRSPALYPAELRVHCL